MGMENSPTRVYTHSHQPHRKKERRILKEWEQKNQREIVTSEMIPLAHADIENKNCASLVIREKKFRSDWYPCA